jgi:hypothetical protein
MSAYSLKKKEISAFLLWCVTHGEKPEKCCYLSLLAVYARGIKWGIKGRLSDVFTQALYTHFCSQEIHLKLSTYIQKTVDNY